MEITQPDLTAMLQQAINQPGKAMDGYRNFWNYSPCNQFLALLQSPNSGASPINTYNGWKSLGRQVKKGAKAIALYMPITCKKVDAAGEENTFTRFVMRKNWFYLSDTEGAEYVAPVVPGFSYDKLLTAHGITQVPYAGVNGNSQGYARGNTIAINPLAQCPEKTMLHEVAHILLGHTGQGETMQHGDILPKDVKEVEAEGTAYLVASCLGFASDTLAYSRDYIQGWLSGGELSDTSKRRIFSAAGKILASGRV